MAIQRNRKHDPNKICVGCETPLTDKNCCTYNFKAKDYRCTSCSNKRRFYIKYGIAYSMYESICVDQNGACAIGGQPPIGKFPILVVDHDHTTGKIRGLLCGTCNSGLGMLKDSAVIAYQAWQYLLTYKGK